MRGWKWISRIADGWQDHDWMKLDATTPYHYAHRDRKGGLEFVNEYHFKRYLGKSFGSQTHTNKCVHKNSKRKKLYWNLHRNQKQW